MFLLEPKGFSSILVCLKTLFGVSWVNHSLLAFFSLTEIKDFIFFHYLEVYNLLRVQLLTLIRPLVHLNMCVDYKTLKKGIKAASK